MRTARRWGGRAGRWGGAVAVLGAVFAAGGLVGARLSLARATTSNENAYAAVGQLGRVLVQIENNYVEPVDRARLVEGAMKGMVGELDPHSNYMPPDEYALFHGDTEGKFGGVGIEVDARGEALTVIAPIEGSPAARAGIRSGDKILQVDGEDALPSKLDKIVRKMRGTPGTHVKLTVRRDGTKTPIVFDLVREVIHVPSVASKLLDGKIGYLRIKQFQEHTHDELLTAAARLRSDAKGAIAGIVLDLRTDPGGLVDEASEVADEFLDAGTIFTMRHRGAIVEEARARGGGAFVDVPTVVLVNEYSASASELVTGALQDNKRAIVVGANTFGKGSVQSIIDLPNGAGLRLTTARYYTPSGHAIQADGIHPDVVVASQAADGDPLHVVRERDLEGHLPAEGAPHDDDPARGGDGGTVAAATAAGIDVPPAIPDGGTIEGSAAYVPGDPGKGSDVALRVGYQLVRDKLVGKGPIVR